MRSENDSGDDKGKMTMLRGEGKEDERRENDDDNRESGDSDDKGKIIMLRRKEKRE